MMDEESAKRSKGGGVSEVGWLLRFGNGIGLSEVWAIGSETTPSCACARIGQHRKVWDRLCFCDQSPSPCTECYARTPPGRRSGISLRFSSRPFPSACCTALQLRVELFSKRHKLPDYSAQGLTVVPLQYAQRWRAQQLMLSSAARAVTLG